MNMHTTHLLLVMIAVSGSFLFASCSDTSRDSKAGKSTVGHANAETAATPELEKLKSDILLNYADIVYASYQDAQSEAMKLQDKVETFLADPSEVGLRACQLAWLAARKPYGQTEAYRFSSGPIDDESGPEGLLNAWPLDESYIDYVEGNANAGIINDPQTYPSINEELLERLNERGGEENISLGYHAIEFLLWGQDSDAPAALTSGERSYTDYLGGNGAARNQIRRAEYLSLATELLIEHLEVLIEAWDPDIDDNYRSYFLALESNEALEKVLNGIGTLSKSELAGERMFVALSNQDQEDEQSCFSDNTQSDIVYNAMGIRNVYTGSYVRVDGSEISGPALYDLVQVLDAELASELMDLSDQAVRLCEQIPVPFDHQLMQEEVGGDGPIMSAILVLQVQGDKLAEVTHLLNQMKSVVCRDC